jgi:hypothetical protein
MIKSSAAEPPASLQAATDVIKRCQWEFPGLPIVPVSCVCHKSKARYLTSALRPCFGANDAAIPFTWFLGLEKKLHVGHEESIFVSQ